MKEELQHLEARQAYIRKLKLDKLFARAIDLAMQEELASGAKGPMASGPAAPPTGSGGSRRVLNKAKEPIRSRAIGWPKNGNEKRSGGTGLKFWVNSSR